MDTNEPKDFITLPSGPSNNFGYVYDKRMEISKKFDECSSAPGPLVYSKSGRTHFYKVRLRTLKQLFQHVITIISYSFMDFKIIFGNNLETSLPSTSCFLGWCSWYL